VNEDALIGRIAHALRAVAPGKVLLGIGDDAAVWQPSRSNRSVVTTDALVEDVHFARALMSAEDVGHRALAANLSDLAAMGARPVLATVALGFPPETDPEWVVAMYDGIAALARRARCAIAGGDLTRAPAITVAITAIGEVRASNLKTRAGARPGDVVAVTGPLGASAAGLAAARAGAHVAAAPDVSPAVAAFRRPEPRLREGRWLAASRSVRAMMDLSDGLSTDLARLCAASAAGAVLDGIPVHDAAVAVAARTGGDPQAWALGGGEDFELLVAVRRHAFGHLAARFRAHTGRALLPVGRIVGEPGVRRADGSPVGPSGWDHLRSSATE